MSTLKQLSADVFELDSHTPHEMAWIGGGCLLLTFAGIFGVAALGVAADGGPLRLILAAFLTTLVLGIGVTLLSSCLQESYLIGTEGVKLRKRWMGRGRDRLLARRDQIQCLALDGSDRLPRRWRLMLVTLDGQTQELAGYGVQESEDECWQESCRLGEAVAAALGVALRLPEGVDREPGRLLVSPGNPPVLSYSEFSQAEEHELKSLLTALAIFVAAIGSIALAGWLHSQGIW